LARVSGGLPGRAIAALQDDDVWREREETMRRIEALLRSDHHDRLDYANGLANTFGKNREAAYETLAYWLSWWRDLLLIKGGCPDRVVNLDCEADLSREARRFSLRQIVEFIGKVRSAVRQLDANSNPRLTFEVLMLGLPSD
jgi:DNA polymerase III gamma/tau subunit